MSTSQSPLRPHYDTIAKDYAIPRRTSFANRSYYDFWSRQMLAAAALDLRDAVVLDCMSGACEMARVAVGEVKALYANDISRGILAELAPDDPQPSARICASALALPFADHSFDLILIRGGLHHIPQALADALAEMHRLLKPGGWLVCTEAAHDNPIMRIARGILHILSPLFEPGERGFRRSELEMALLSTGFTNININPFGYLGYVLIGNVDVFPLFKGLKERHLIDLLIRFDLYSPRIPLWRSFGLAYLFRAQFQPQKHLEHG